MKLPRLFWPWLAFLATLLLAESVVFNWFPWLRGHISKDPAIVGWEWRYEPGWHTRPILQMLVTMLVLAYLLTISFRERNPVVRATLFIAICVAGILFQYEALRFRPVPPPVNIASRTQTNFSEDFIDAARASDTVGEVYGNLDSLRKTKAHARLLTHPPGMSALYRILATAQETSPAYFRHHLSIIRTYFRNATKTDVLPDAWIFALGWGSVIKASGLWLAMAGVVFIAKGLTRPSKFPHGLALTAFVALIPAVALFSICIDQLIMGLSTLAVGLTFYAYRSPGRYRAAVAAGICLFLESQLAFQILATGWVIGVVTLYLLVTRASKRARFQIVQKATVVLAVFLGLLAMLCAATGYNYLTDLLKGLASHKMDHSQVSRSREAWLIYNNWDMIFFAGFGWLALSPFIGWRKFVRNPLAIALLSLWILLLWRDSMRGEAARIMLLAFPLAASAIWLSLNTKPLKQLLLVDFLLGCQTICFALVLNLF